MRVIRFLSKFTFICNLTFLVYVMLTWLEAKSKINGSPGNMLQIPFLKELIIILGYSAIFINFIMIIIYLVLLLTRRLFVPKWIVIANFVFLLIEIYYHFLSRN